jgi:hypothetical protein
MSQMQLNRISRDIIEQAEKGLLSGGALPRVVDDYFVQRLKEDEMAHAQVDARLYEGLRAMVKAEVLPLYDRYLRDTAAPRARRQARQLWLYVLGTVGGMEILEAILTRGRSFAPAALVTSALLYSFIGFIVYAAAQYIDDLQIARARKRLNAALDGLGTRVQVDADYDNRRQLVESDVLHAEAVEILARYERPEDFWRDYLKIRQLDPTAPSELKALNLPAFEKFLLFHVNGQHSPVARQHRFNRLFIEAQEIFIGRDRENYVVNHLKPKGK